MKADLLRKLAKDFRSEGKDRLADVALIALAKESGSATPRSDLSYSYLMRELRKGDPERLRKFMETFKQAFDKAYVEDIDDPDNAALMEAMQAIDYESDSNEDNITGGLADHGKPKDLDPKQLEKGIKVEKEHTNSKDIAREIALDHLTEDPKYYDKLDKIEKSQSGSVNRIVKLAESLVTMEDPAMAARGIAAIVHFLTRRIEPNKRLYSLFDLKRKIYELDEFQIASKKSPSTASLGQSITFIKTILNGRPPYYVRRVINEVVKNL